ncbi:MAG: protein kinase [Chloroflexi bacterium]|nr:protein kinase [Chloroflexota bacterium]
MPNWTGRTIGKVYIGELIARGGMAEVYLGEHASLNRKVAVKIMREHVDTDPENQKRFEREARVVAGLRHPNIIQMFDYELADGQPCLIMELVEGASLANYLKALHKRGEKLSYDMIARILSPLASAVDYAHSQNMVHRDLKPANVLLRSASGPVDPNLPLPADVEPILTDFGLVRLLDSSIQTSTGTVSGTPTYMSPEQARGERVDRRTDIYSLGVMLYEMLAGVVPFDAESSFGVLMKHLNDPPPAIDGISTDLQTIIDRALSKDPDLRYHSAKEMVDEFISVFNGQTVSLQTLTIVKVAQASLQKNKGRGSINWTWVGIGALVILIASIIAFRFLRPPVAPHDLPVGQVAFADQNALVDKATVKLTDLPVPDPGMHYDVWLLAQGGETRRNIGTVSMDEGGQGNLTFTIPSQENILQAFDQVEITLEPDNDPTPNDSSGNIAASSVFPPFAFIHIRHLIVAFPGAPEQTALMQGLWNSVDAVDNSTSELQLAFSRGDEAQIREKTEEIINEIAGSANTNQYLDWDKNGTIDDASDGFGLLENGDPGYTDQGYISQAKSHAKFAAQAPDATQNIKLHSEHVIICLDNMNGWTIQLLEKALQLQKMPFGPDMETVINEMAALADQITSGTDSNGNELIEPIIGEGGATTAYEHAYYMADMPLYPGAHRIPPPAPTTLPAK